MKEKADHTLCGRLFVCCEEKIAGPDKKYGHRISVLTTRGVALSFHLSWFAAAQLPVKMPAAFSAWREEKIADPDKKIRTPHKRCPYFWQGQ